VRSTFNKLLLVLLVSTFSLAVLLLVGLLLSPGAESSRLPVLFRKWVREGTPEAEKAWTAERNRLWAIDAGAIGVVGLLAVAKGVALIRIWKKS